MDIFDKTAPAYEETDWRPNMKMITKMFKNKDGATAIEYGLIAALIAVAAIAGMSTLGTRIGGGFNNVTGNLR